jgi:hypothetical protein
MTSASRGPIVLRKRSGNEVASQKRTRLELVNRLHNKTVRGSNLKDLKADDCTINGDNNHVIGNFNILIGRNNTADGTGNTFSVPVDPPRPPPLLPSVQPQSRPAEPQSLVSALTEMSRMLFLAEMGQFPSAQRQLMYSPPPPPPVEAARAAAPVDELARPVATEKDSAQWVQCALDLPGEAMPTDSEELRCVVCMENQRDTLFRPCRHLCCCRTCVRALAVQKPKKITSFDCPKCRQSVESMTIVFL